MRHMNIAQRSYGNAPVVGSATREAMAVALSISVAAAALFATAAAHSAPKPQVWLADAPADRAVLAEAFAAAWREFRTDIDAAPRAKIPPPVLDAFFAAAPRFAIRDALQLASEPQAVLAAARRMVGGASGIEHELLRDRWVHSEGTSLFRPLFSIRVAARDRRAEREAVTKLRSERPEEAMEGALALAAAKDARGFDYLRRCLALMDDSAAAAAKALGAYGDDSDEARLSAALTTGIDPDAVTAALGMHAARRVFPLHYRAIEAHDTMGKRFETPGGIYDRWFAAIGRAIGSKVRDSQGLVGYLERETVALKGSANEALGRDLKALIDVWTDVEFVLREPAPSALWPKSFSEAVSRLSDDASGASPSAGISRRFAAAIAILATAGAALEHEKRAVPDEFLRFSNEKGNAAADGDFTTGFRREKKKDRLVFELPADKRIQTLWIALGCGNDEASRVNVVVSDASQEPSWSVSRDFSKAPAYFEQIYLGAPRGGRVEVKIEVPKGSSVCVSELRVE